MNTSEFNQWLGHHFATFPTAGAYLAKDYPETSTSATTPSRRQILGSWARQLEAITFDEALAATDEMARSDAEPRKLEEHPRAIRRLALATRQRQQREAPQRRYYDGEQAYACRTCRDNGIVPVHDWRVIRAVRFFGEFNGQQYMGARAQLSSGDSLLCPAIRCNARDRIGPAFLAARGNGPEDLYTYNPDRDGPIIRGWRPEDRQAALLEWIDAHPVTRQMEF